jgi:hypothetical protein
MSSWRRLSATTLTGGTEAPVGPGYRARRRQPARRRPTGRPDGAIHSTGPVAIRGTRAGLDFRAVASAGGLLRSPCHPKAPVRVGAASLSGGGLLSDTGNESGACCPRRTDRGFRGGPVSGSVGQRRPLRCASFRPLGWHELGAFERPYRPNPATDHSGVGGFGGLGITIGWSSRSRPVTVLAGQQGPRHAGPAAQPRVGQAKTPIRRLTSGTVLARLWPE